MSLRTRNRLHAITLRLTPTQAACAYVREANAHGSFDNHADALHGQPLSAMPLPRVCNQAAAAVRHAMPRQDPELVLEAMRQARQDAAYLVHLHLELTGRFSLLAPALQLRYRVLATELEVILRLQRQRETFLHALETLHASQPRRNARPLAGPYDRECRAMALVTLRRERPSQTLLTARTERWLAGVRALLVDLGAMAHGAAELADQYFHGEELLFPDQRTLLSTLLVDTTGLLAIYNELAEHLQHPNLALDRLAVQQDAAALGSILAATTRTLAESRMLDKAGRAEEGHAVLDSFSGWLSHQGAA